jgi:hypothetical protein
MYALGVDLGTTYTAAATSRDGHAEIASLGSRAAVIPSVVLSREDGDFLVGESANRRGLSEPSRVAREFKRRLGDPTPILLDGAPHTPESLLGRLLRSVVDQVAASEGGPAAALCLSHPANWGSYKQDRLAQAVRGCGVGGAGASQRDAGGELLDRPVAYTTEPEAAAVFYAQQQRVEPGAVVAVYDLGGGTFDAAVLRKTATATGFEILGQPEGIERLGGIDFDAAVFNHVRQALGSKLDELDEDDPAAIAAVARLRDECVAAKEALSSDTDTAIPVLLPNTTTEVRLTRAELEAMVRPTLHSTIEALRRTLRSAGVPPEQLHSVLLVGGASRMPLVSQLVGAELGRPVAVDAHPKHAVALGAAQLAAATLGPPVRPAAPPVPSAAAPPAAAPSAPAAPPASPVPPVSPAVPPVSPAPPAASPRAPVPAPPAPHPVPTGAAAAVPYAPPSPTLAGRAAVPPRQPDPDDPTRLYGSRPPRSGSAGRRRLLLVAAGAAVLVFATAGIALAVRGDSDTPPPSPGPTTASPAPSPTGEPSPTADPTGQTDAPPPPPPPPPTTSHPSTPTPSGSPSAVPMAEVPDVRGFECLFAQGFLNEKGFTAEMIGPPEGATEPTVTSQYPAPGTSHPVGSSVRIYCA